MNKLCYSVGNEIITLSYLDKPYFILNFIANEDKIYLSDKNSNVIFYKVDSSVLNFQTIIMRGGDSEQDNLIQTVFLYLNF